MPSLKAIRKRIQSVQSTQKITRAMKMVAGARLNRAQQAIVAMRPYAVKTGEVLASVAASKKLSQKEQELFTAQKGFKQLYESLPSLLSPYARLGSS